MEAMTHEDLNAYFARYLGSLDPDDPKTRKRLHILSAATELFATQGYRKTSVDQVARAAGVAKGTVYSYFATKIDLLIAAVLLEKKESTSVMGPVFDRSRPAADRLRDYITMTMLMPSRMPISTALAHGDQELAAVMAEIPEEMMAERSQLLDGMLGSLIEEVAGEHKWTPREIRDRAEVISHLPLLSVQLDDPLLRGGLSIERYAEIMADLVVSGLAAKKGTEQ